MAGLGMERLRPAPEEGSLWSAAGATESSVMELTADLMDAISADSGCSTLLAIDDFHLVDSSPHVVDAVGLIARGLPPGWTLLVSSRRPLPFDLEAVSLGGRSRRRWRRETCGSPRARSAPGPRSTGISPWSPRKRGPFGVLSEGWPAGLVLLGQQLVSRGRVTRGDLVGMMSRGRDLRTYLERHILSGLDPFTAEIMLAGALLPRLIFPRDEEYLPGRLRAKPRRRWSNWSPGGFSSLGRAGAATPCIPSSGPTRSARRGGATQGAVAISRAAAHLERIGENHRAASLYLRAGRFDDAARPLRALALSSLNAVVDFAHDGWADLLPGDDDASAGAWLLVAKARMLQQQAKYAPAAGPLRAGRPSTCGRRRTTRVYCPSYSARCSACSIWVNGTRAWPW